MHSHLPIDCRMLPVTHESSLVGDHRQTLRTAGIRWYTRRLAKASRHFQTPGALPSESLTYAISSLHFGWLPSSAPLLWMCEGTRIDFRSRLVSLAAHGLKIHHFLVLPERVQPLAIAEISLVPVRPGTNEVQLLTPRQLAGGADLLRPYESLPWPPPTLAIKHPPTAPPTSAELCMLPMTALIQAADALSVVDIGAAGRVQDKASRTFLESLGWANKTASIDLVCVQAHCRFHSHVPAGGAMEVRTRAVGRSADQLHFTHFLCEPEAGNLLASAEVFAMTVTDDLQHQATLPPSLVESFDALLAKHAALEWPARTQGTWLERLAGNRGP